MLLACSTYCTGGFENNNFSIIRKNVSICDRKSLFIIRNIRSSRIIAIFDPVGSKVIFFQKIRLISPVNRIRAVGGYRNTGSQAKDSQKQRCQQLAFLCAGSNFPDSFFQKTGVISGKTDCFCV